jgi:hypothetical protein
MKKFSYRNIVRNVRTRPFGDIKTMMTKFSRSRIWKEVSKYFKIATMRYSYCKPVSNEMDEAAFYIMGTKKSPMIFICDQVLHRVFGEMTKEGFERESIQRAFNSVMIHELTHAYLDIKNIKRHSESVINTFSLACAHKGIHKSKKIINDYIAKKKGKKA